MKSGRNHPLGEEKNLNYLYRVTMAWLLENVGFVEPEGETIQILSCSKSVAPSRGLLI
jgi:hypothetical protein